MSDAPAVPPETSEMRAAKARSRRLHYVAAAALALAILVPYWRLALMQAVVITDDVFVSDIFGYEFPVRVWAGDALRSGEMPVWNRDIACGTPATMIDPPSLLLFALLPPVWAMNIELLLILIIAAWGTYAYGRQIGLTRAGASLAAIAYAYSGFMVCQLKHVSAVEVTCLMPVGLLLLERAFGAPRGRRVRMRARYASLTLFGMVVGEQILIGFPQSAYYCFLFYGAYAVVRAQSGLWRDARRRMRAVRLLAMTGLAALLGVGIGSPLLVLLRDFQGFSDRHEGVPYEWASQFSYHWRSLYSFFIPYYNGDVSNGTYRLDAIFWEEYGYVGVLTAVLGLAAAGLVCHVKWARIFAGALVISGLLVIGPTLPTYRWAFDHVPGMSNFRFTQRAMFIADFALVTLAGIALTTAQRATARRPHLRTVGAVVAWLIVAGTLGDLVYNQMRQNAFADADTFMTPPTTAQVLAHQRNFVRYFSFAHRQVHSEASLAAHGWADLRPFEAQRDMLEPNTGLFWDLPSANGYITIKLRHVTDVLGDHNRLGLADTLPAGSAEWNRILALNAVSHVVSPFLLDLPLLSPDHEGIGMVFALPSPLPRAYVATRVRLAPSPSTQYVELLAEDFAPGRDVVFTQGESGGLPAGDIAPPVAAPLGPPTATIVEDRQTLTEIDVDAPGGGVVVLADSYFPAWTATVDDAAAEIYLVNHSQRGVIVAPGHHRVRFALSWRSFRVAVGFAVLCFVLLVGLWLWLRRREPPRVGFAVNFIS